MPWEFARTEQWPQRFRACTQDGDITWWAHLDNVPENQFPVLDCLHMQCIVEPPPPSPITAANWIFVERNSPMTTSASSSVPQDALVDLRIGRHEGRLTLEINAKPLHDLLDSMGARVSGNMYADRPTCTSSTVSNNGKLSTDLLLKREYPVRLALAGCFTRPPTHRQLKELCESGHAAVTTILDHYRPVDIRYTIVKVVK
jgi:hypothetical protein